MNNFRDKALRTIHASVSTVVYDGGVTTATDIDGNVVTLDESAIATEVARLEAAWTATDYTRTRADAYPSIQDFMEAYTEKEIGSDSTKWDAYVIAYNKVRTDNPK